jgi:oligopeptide transport system ATP-binding protein
MNSIPRLDQKGTRLNPITGAPPNLMHIPSGCSFHPRCPYVRENCLTDVPVLYEVNVKRGSACHYWKEVIATTQEALRGG